MKIQQLPALRVLVIIISCLLSIRYLGIGFTCGWFSLFVIIIYLKFKELKTAVVFLFLGAICVVRFGIVFSSELPENCFRVTKVLKSNHKKISFIGEGAFNAVFTLNKSGDLQWDYIEGDIIEFENTFQGLPNPKSLNGFIYADYLKSLEIDSVAYSNTRYNLVYRDSSSFSFMASEIRTAVIKYLNSFHSIKASTKGVTIALLTGDKSFLSTEDKALFRDTGVIHVLAISGMHVGILYLTLSSLFLSILRIPQKLGFFIIVFILISYAFVTGLSPSVIRAVIMFGLIQFGHSFQKNPNTLNIIFVGAGLMLFFDPGLIKNIGFQLSYVAVIGIVLIIQHTRLSKVIKSKYLNWVWCLFLVSTAAFVFTSPVLAFHFGIINMTGLWSSVIIVPLITVVMYLAFSVLILFFHKPSAEFVYKILNSVFEFITNILSVLVEFLNVRFLAVLTFTEVMIVYVLIISWIFKRVRYLWCVLGLFLIQFISPSFKELKVLKKENNIEVRLDRDTYHLKLGDRLGVNGLIICYEDVDSLKLIGLDTVLFVDFNVNKYQSVKLGM